MQNLLKILLFLPLFSFGQNTYQIAILKYNGGGDWYANPTAIPNLIAFSNENNGTNIKKNQQLLKLEVMIFLIIPSSI